MKLFKSEKPSSSSNRQVRLCQEVQRFISNLMVRQVLPPVTIDGVVVSADPMTSITRADVSPDMKTAKIYVRHLDQDRLQPAIDYLEAVKSPIRHAMAKELNMRFTPALSFHIDSLADQERKIDELFYKIRSETSE